MTYKQCKKIIKQICISMINKNINKKLFYIIFRRFVSVELE